MEYPSQYDINYDLSPYSPLDDPITHRYTAQLGEPCRDNTDCQIDQDAVCIRNVCSEWNTLGVQYTDPQVEAGTLSVSDVTLCYYDSDCPVDNSVCAQHACVPLASSQVIQPAILRPNFVPVPVQSSFNRQYLKQPLPGRHETSLLQRLQPMRNERFKPARQGLGQNYKFPTPSTADNPTTIAPVLQSQHREGITWYKFPRVSTSSIPTMINPIEPGNTEILKYRSKYPGKGHFYVDTDICSTQI
jgi:hypothetical protein